MEEHLKEELIGIIVAIIARRIRIIHAQWSCVDDEKNVHLLFILPVAISVRKGRKVWRKPIPSLPSSATEKIGEFYFDSLELDVGRSCRKDNRLFPTTIPTCSSNSDQGRTKYAIYSRTKTNSL